MCFATPIIYTELIRYLLTFCTVCKNLREVLNRSQCTTPTSIASEGMSLGVAFMYVEDAYYTTISTEIGDGEGGEGDHVGAQAWTFTAVSARRVSRSLAGCLPQQSMTCRHWAVLQSQ